MASSSGSTRSTHSPTAAPGFVWRLQTEAGNATYLRPYDDERILINLSVWETVEGLRNFVYGGSHAEVLRQRGE